MAVNSYDKISWRKFYLFFCANNIFYLLLYKENQYFSMIVGNYIMYTTNWQEKDCKALHFLLFQKKKNPYNTKNKISRYKILLIGCKLKGLMCEFFLTVIVKVLEWYSIITSIWINSVTVFFKRKLSPDTQKFEIRTIAKH